MPGSAGVSPVGSAHHAWERGRLACVCNTQYRCPCPTMKMEHIWRLGIKFALPNQPWG
jgi:hypothetical protein